MMEAANLQGEKLVVLTAAEYADLIEDAGDAALAAGPRGPAMPADLARQIWDGSLHPLTAWRKATGLSMADLAQKAGVRTASVSDIENGRIDPRYSTVKALARALALSPDDIMPE